MDEECRYSAPDSSTDYVKRSCETGSNGFFFTTKLLDVLRPDGKVRPDRARIAWPWSEHMYSPLVSHSLNMPGAQRMGEG